VIYSAVVIENGKAASAGDTIQLKATVKGADKKAVWSSSNKNVATVDAEGKVTSVSAGTAVITATANGKSSDCKITVQDNAISLNIENMLLSTKGTGSSIKLTPAIVGSSKKVTWTSSNTAVATVKGGKVTGKQAGEAVITAAANGVEAKCNVKVEAGLISINEEKVLLYVTEKNPGKNETKQLKTNASKNDTVTWSSSNPDIAEVDSAKGLVQAKRAGTAIITAECNGKTDTCEVNVADTAVVIAEKIIYLKTKGNAKTYTLDYVVNGRKNSVKWISSDKKVATVSKGKVTAKKEGTATITAEANGVSNKVIVNVQKFAPSISLNQSEYTLYTTGSGNKVTLKASIDGDNKKAEWKSDAPDVATVTNGKVTAVKKGQALISATANGVTANCLIRVKESKVVIEKKYYLLNPGDTENLSVDIIGASQSAKYATSNSKVVTVKKGVVTAKKVGEAKITVTANGVPAYCTVIVTDHKDHIWEPVPEKDKETDDREAKCEESGLVTYICTECGAKKQDVSDPLGHAFGKWTITVKATENAAGLETQVCSRCGVENTRTIPAKRKGEVAQAYKLVWEDNFNGNDGDRVNEADWNYEVHEPGWVNAELQAYVDDAKNAYIENNQLHIKAIKEVIDGKEYYTSGRINTQGKHDFTYGRFEVSAKVPAGKGFLPAFWMMPTDESYYGQWPKCGELDIMEVLGSETSTAYGTLHFGEPHTQQQGTYTLSGGKSFADEFHVFACEWDPGEIRFYVDDICYYRVSDWFTKREGFGKVAYPAPYDQPFYIIMNLAVGGSWVGYPDETTAAAFAEDRAEFIIDYVRAYQKDSYDTDVDRPETEVVFREPDENGNYILNGDFSKAENLTDENSNWKLTTANGGEGNAEISNKELHVTMTQPGDVNYGVQVLQAGVPMFQGKEYTLTYDAYADAPRTIITDISAPDRGWSRYLNDTTVNLTTEKQTIEHKFTVTDESDPNGSLEFNFGNQGSTEAVHISNVSLTITGEIEVEENKKSVLPDGNYVYN
ncbi:MAG: Ig-like domain-containing protein, partial [Lachnospiraceae bacterium]|nr:Ig-like domain-containing protein [Lachnospiraceae bacterium]